MEHNFKLYALSWLILGFLVTIIFLGAPLIGFILFLVGGYLIYRSRTGSGSALGAFSRWLNRNRYSLAFAILISILSGFVFVSSSPQTRFYGFPAAFVIYYPQPHEFTSSMRLLSSIAVRLPEFFLNVVFYYAPIWIVLRIRKRVARAT
jgi:hypothetical protein